MSVYAKLWRRMAPPWFVGPHISTFYEAVGSVLDCEAQRAMDGRLASIVYAGAEPFAAKLSTGQRIECQPDALPQHFLDRSLTPYPSESILSQRLRLSRWHQLHADRGTPWGVIDHVRPYFASWVAAGGIYPTIRVVSQTNEATPSALWYTTAANGARSIRKVSPSNWDWDGTPNKRTRFWGIIHLPPGYAGSGFVWDAGPAWDSGPVWDGLPAQVFADLWAMMNDWHGAHSHFGGLIVTDLQPADDIPGWPGVHPFDPASVYHIDGAGQSTLPLGNWGSPVYTTGAFLGNITRPSWATFVNINNG